MTTPRATPNPIFTTFSPTALKGKVALLNGAAGGIGQEMALQMARVGASLVLCDRDVEPLKPTAEEIHVLGRRALTLRCEVRDPDQIAQAVERTVAEFGKVDILVNYTPDGPSVPAQELSYDGWHETLNGALHGSWYFSQAAARRMIKQGGGAIVNIVSAEAWTGAAGRVHVASAAAGVWNLTKTLGAEWGKYNIRANCIALPADAGGLGGQWREHAEGQPMRREVTPQEVAWLAIFLASDAASYITGECVDLTGGGLGGRLVPY